MVDIVKRIAHNGLNRFIKILSKVLHHYVNQQKT